MAEPTKHAPPSERFGWAIKQQGAHGRVTAEPYTFQEGDLPDDEVRAYCALQLA